MKQVSARVFCILVTLFLFTSCQAVSDWYHSGWNTGVQKVEADTAVSTLDPALCTHQAAYQKGVADARAEKSMAAKYPHLCPNNAELLNVVYRQGFENGTAARLTGRDNTQGALANAIAADAAANSAEPITPIALLTSASRSPVLVPGSGNKLKIKPYNPAEFRCFIDNFGTKTCGYYCDYSNGVIKCADSIEKRCVKNDAGELACGYHCVSTAKTVKCAESADQKCLSDIYGNVQCGTNCRRSAGQVVCQ